MTGPTRRQLLAAVFAGVVGGAPLLIGGCATPPAGVRRSVHRYGPAPFQDAELWRPARHDGVVVLVHGGYWRAGRRRSQLDPIAADLALRGWAVWNVDYRGFGEGGGWPGTFTDVAAAVDLLAPTARRHDVVPDPLVVIGHSAGGQLGLWLTARQQQRSAELGGPPALPVTAVAALAGVDDLTRAALLHLGRTAVPDLMGGSPDQVPQHYALADPLRLVPLRVPVLALTGLADHVLPVAQTTAFARAAQAAGDDVRLELVPGEDHGAPINPRSRSWQLITDWLAARRGGPVTTIAPPRVALPAVAAAPASRQQP